MRVVLQWEQWAINGIEHFLDKKDKIFLIVSQIEI